MNKFAPSVQTERGKRGKNKSKLFAAKLQKFRAQSTRGGARERAVASEMEVPE